MRGEGLETMGLTHGGYAKTATFRVLGREIFFLQTTFTIYNL